MTCLFTSVPRLTVGCSGVVAMSVRRLRSSGWQYAPLNIDAADLRSPDLEVPYKTGRCGFPASSYLGIAAAPPLLPFLLLPLT